MRRPKECLDPGPCQGGECGKCGYYRRSGYPFFHALSFTPTFGERIVGLVFGLPLAALIVVPLLVWGYLIHNPRPLSPPGWDQTPAAVVLRQVEHRPGPQWSDPPHAPVVKTARYRVGQGHVVRLPDENP